MLNLGGALDLGGACDSFLLCVILRAFTFIFMYCIIYMWWRDLCNICAFTWLCSFALLLHFYSDSNVFYFMYSCLIHIFWVHHVGLGHISMSNPFCSYYQKHIWTKHVENLTHLFYILEVVLSSITKMGRLKASRSLVGFRWLMMTRDYYD